MKKFKTVLLVRYEIVRREPNATAARDHSLDDYCADDWLGDKQLDEIHVTEIPE